MKIRIKGNSLRYRLTRSDINILAETGLLEEKTTFGSNTLIYALERHGGYEMFANFENNRITLFMPDTLINEWHSTEKVGFEGLHNGLLLLAEKDFKCLDNVTEDQSDNYPNPLANY